MTNENNNSIATSKVGVRDCKFGMSCIREGCWFNHDVNATVALCEPVAVECRNGNTCYKKSCPYQHNAICQNGVSCSLLKLNMCQLRHILHPLLVAAQVGDCSAVKEQIDLGICVEMKDEKDYTSLHWATQNNRVDVVRMLVKHNANVEARNEFDQTPLHLACFFGHENVFDELVKMGADVNVRDSKGGTPLHKACKKGQPHMVNKLIDNGANIDAQDDMGNTPVHRAFQCDSRTCIGIAEILISRNADLSICNRYQQTPLHATFCSSEKVRQDLLELSRSVRATVANVRKIAVKSQFGDHKLAITSHRQLNDLQPTAMVNDASWRIPSAVCKLVESDKVANGFVTSGISRESCARQKWFLPTAVAVEKPRGPPANMNSRTCRPPIVAPVVDCPIGRFVCSIEDPNNVFGEVIGTRCGKGGSLLYDLDKSTKKHLVMAMNQDKTWKFGASPVSSPVLSPQLPAVEVQHVLVPPGLSEPLSTESASPGLVQGACGLVRQLSTGYDVEAPPGQSSNGFENKMMALGTCTAPSLVRMLSNGSPRYSLWSSSLIQLPSLQ